jgi:hypothetical protein
MRANKVSCIEFQSPHPHQSSSGLIIIREHATPSSCDTYFTDAVSSIGNYENLTVTKLEQIDIVSDARAALQFIRNESISVDGSKCAEEEGGEMPIVRNGSSVPSNGQQLHAGSDASDKDKGMFNVSRVKKVELSEIPLATDISTVAASSSSSIACEFSL